MTPGNRDRLANWHGRVSLRVLLLALLAAILLALLSLGLIANRQTSAVHARMLGWRSSPARGRSPTISPDRRHAAPSDCSASYPNDPAITGVSNPEILASA